MKLENYKDLLQGAYDLHTHSAPSHFQRSVTDVELLLEAEEMGMAGVMIKSHYQPTEARAALINKILHQNCQAYGGLALNHPVGGLNPYAVESSLSLGAKIIWMPTRDSLNSLMFGHMPGDFFERKGIPITNERGQLLPILYDIIELVKKYDAVLATGHVSIPEGILLCREANRLGCKNILTHPDWSRTKYSLEDQKMLAKEGTFIEKCWFNVLDHSVSAEELVKSVRNVQDYDFFLSTDTGQMGNEHPAKAMYSFVMKLIELGISKDSIQKGLREIPKKILNLQEV